METMQDDPCDKYNCHAQQFHSLVSTWLPLKKTHQQVLWKKCNDTNVFMTNFLKITKIDKREKTVGQESVQALA